MKKIWNVRKENEGVSPVIATILMVAITVVLAAVLYVMVIGMTPKGEPIPPAGSVTFDVLGSTGVQITFGTFSPTPEPMGIKVIITNNSDATDVVELTFSTTPDATTVDMTATGGASATYTDLNYNGNAVNSGDFMTIEGLGPHTTYKLTLFHYDTQSVCPLVGDKTFNLP